MAIYTSWPCLLTFSLSWLGTKRQGNVFTPVCQSFRSEAVSVPACTTRDMSRGVYPGGLCPKGVSVQGGVSVQEASIQGGLCPGGVSVSGRPTPYGNARRHASYWNPFLLQGMQLIVSLSNWLNFLGRCSLLALALLQTENRILFAMRSLKSFIRKTMKTTLF